jgi:hypothetical protein
MTRQHLFKINQHVTKTTACLTAVLGRSIDGHERTKEELDVLLKQGLESLQDAHREAFGVHANGKP